MKAFALACLAVASSAVTLEQSSCPFCQGIEKPIVHIDASVLDGAGWAATVLQPQNIASIATTSKAYSTGKVARQKGRFVDLCPNAGKCDFSPDQKIGGEIVNIENIPGSTSFISNLGNVQNVGASEYDQKLLTEGWKIGQSADTFLPTDMNLRSVVRAQMLPGIAPISEYDNKLLTEGWKIGQSAETFLPPEMNVGAVRAQASNVGSEYDQKLLTEGWKIGQSADTFLPADMNVRSVIRA
jgi:hypothetical protein